MALSLAVSIAWKAAKGILEHTHECACTLHTLLILRHYFSCLIHLPTCLPGSRVPHAAPCHRAPPLHFLSCFHLWNLVFGLVLKSAECLFSGRCLDYPSVLLRGSHHLRPGAGVVSVL